MGLKWERKNTFKKEEEVNPVPFQSKHWIQRRITNFYRVKINIKPDKIYQIT